LEAHDAFLKIDDKERSDWIGQGNGHWCFCFSSRDRLQMPA